jgi:O-antigen/teichoic acid export membrane protein
LIRALIRTSFAYGVMDFLGKFLAFASFPLFAALFDVAEFGAIALVTTVAGLAGLLANPGLNNAVQRFYLSPEYGPERRPLMVSAGLLTLALWVCGVTVALVAAAYLLRDSLAARHGLQWAWLLPALLLCAPGQIVAFAQDLLRLHFRPWAFGAASLLRNAAWIAVALALIQWGGMRVEGYFAGQLAAMLFAMLVLLWLVRRDLVPRFDRTIARELVSYGYPFIFGGLAIWLLQSIDLWMLSALATDIDVGLYGVAAKLSAIVVFLNTALGQAWAPFALKAYAEDPNYRAMVARFFTVWFLALTLAGATLSLFASDILHLLTPPAYWTAAPVASVLVFGAVIAGTTQVTVLALSIERRTGLIAVCAWLAVSASLAANWALVPRFGALGAAAANVLTYLFLSAAYLWFSQRVHPLPLERAKLVLVVALACLAAAAALYLEDSVGLQGFVTRAGVLVALVVVAAAAGAFDPRALVRLARAGG